MDSRHVGVLGATSLVGICLQQLLPENGWRVTAFSRKPVTPHADTAQITWRQLARASIPESSAPDSTDEKISLWICAAPIWVLPEHFKLLSGYGIKRIVILSSTSSITKQTSIDVKEQKIVQQLIEGENRVATWAAAHQIEWIILRPTLIYGLGRDKNISEIIRFIRRFGFFPLIGKATGLRQPVHARDVAAACMHALQALNLRNCAYNLSGGETLSYREMVRRIFLALDRKPRLVNLPFRLFHYAVIAARCLPRYRQWNSGMAARMNQDMVFDSSALWRQLRISARPFTLSREDLR
jgi:dTDP-4-dehydrorhamnose reductase